MALELDISTDFASIVDGLKPISVDGVAVANSLRRAVTTKDVEKRGDGSGGFAQLSDTFFHVDKAEYAARPSLGKQIEDQDGEFWTIIQVQEQTLKNRWRILSRQLKIDDETLTVQIQTATYAKSATGAMEPTFVGVATVPARIKYDSEQIRVEHGSRTTNKKAFVYFAAEQGLDSNYRLIASDGTVLHVKSWDGFDSIEMLFRATCEVSKWPHA